MIQGFTKGRNITFTIWGHETRPDNRKVRFETVVLSTRKPPKDVVKRTQLNRNHMKRPLNLLIQDMSQNYIRLLL